MPPSIDIKNASLSCTAKNPPEKIIFSDVSLHLPADKWVSLLGPSGIGKTSLLRLIAGLTPPKAKATGLIYADNNISVEEQIAYMAQTDLLLPWLTVFDNILLRHKLRCTTKQLIKQQKIEARHLLNKVGLENCEHLYPHQLSGGMRQRVALVRTLIEDKPIVLMDEPFSAVDAVTRYELQNLAIELLQNKTVLFITHDPSEALRLADEIYIMQAQGIKHFMSLKSAKPRALTEIVAQQTLLFAELGQAKEKIA